MSLPRSYAYKKHTLLWLAKGFDFLGSFFSKTRSQPKSWGRKILVVRLDQLGDIVQTLPFFEALRTLSPESEIHFLTSSVGAQLNNITKSADHTFVWNCPWFDRHRTPNVSLGEVCRWIHSQNFDTVFELRGDIRLIMLMKWAGVKNIVGYGATGGGFLLDQEFPWQAERHAVDKNLALLGERKPTPSIYPSIPIAVSSKSSSKIIAVHPDAGTNAKKWPAPSFISTIRELVDNKTTVILVGLDHNLGEKIAQPFLGQVKNMMGKTNLGELVTLLSGCNGLLTNDSGPAHVMAALDKPVGIVWAGTADPAVWAPRGPKVKIFTYPVPCAPCSSAECFVSGHPCLTQIQPHDVAKWILQA